MKQIQIGIAMAILIILIAASSASVIVLLNYKAFAQEQSSGLKVLSSNGFNDNNEFSPSYHIVGEVQNNGSQTVKFVQVSATLYDKNNQVIGTDFAYTKPSTIEPGMKAPFEILIDKDKVKGGDLGIIDHFATQISTS